MREAPRTVRLLHVTTVADSFRFLRGQLRYMRERGIVAEVVSSPSPYQAEFAAQEGVRVHAIEMRRAITPVQDTLALARMVRLVRRVSPDIVHAQTPKGGLLGILAATATGVPVRIYHMRGLRFVAEPGVRRALLQGAERLSCSLAHRVLCVSRSVRDEAVAQSLCPPDRIDVLGGGSGNGVDAMGRFDPSRLPPGTRAATRAAHGIPSDALVVGFVGRLVPDKGIEELAAAWKTLRERFPTAHLLLVGPFEDDTPLTGSLVRTLRDDPRVHLTGWVSDVAGRDQVPALYAAMDVLALPTHREGFPNTVLEGSAMALPVVATQVMGCVDAVEEGVTGTLVPVAAPDALAAAIDRYLGDAGLRARHGAAGRERVLRNYRPELIWEAVYQEYLRLLRTHHRPVPSEPVRVEAASPPP